MARIYYSLQLYREQPVLRPEPSVFRDVWDIIMFCTLWLILYVIACVLLAG